MNRDILTWRTYLVGLAIIALVFTGIMSLFWEQNRQALAARDEVLRAQEMIDEIHVLSSKLKSAVLAHHRYLMFGDVKNREEYKSFQSKKMNEESLTKHIILPHSVEDDLNVLKILSEGDPIQSERIAQITERFTLIWNALDEVLTLNDNGQRELAMQKLETYIDTQVSPMRVLIRDALHAETEGLKNKTDIRDRETQNRTVFVLAALIAFALLEVVLYTIMMVQSEKRKNAETLATQTTKEIAETNKKLLEANNELSVLNKTIQESKETQIKAIIDHALDGQIMMDSEGTVLRYNRAAQKMFLFTPPEVIGRNIRQLLIEPYAGECLKHFKEHRDSGSCNGTEHRHESVGRRKDSTIFPFDLSMSMFNLGGQLHFSWFVRDITERKKNEADILRYMKELEKSNQDLDDFAYIASHDLKEPLRGLFNHAQFLMEDYQEKLDTDGQRRLGRLSFLAQRMEQLVNDLLYFSRLGRSDLAVQKTDPNQVVLEIEHMLESMIKEKKAKLLIPTPMPEIICDKPRITEVFRNLIVNGIKYNDKENIKIEIGFMPNANAPHGKESNVFYIKDNGIGIEQEYHQEIFRIFRRLQKADEKDQSTGSGLTFVKKIIERHMGHIWLESTPSKGTTFFFNLGIARGVNGDNAEQIASHIAS